MKKKKQQRQSQIAGQGAPRRVGSAPAPPKAFGKIPPRVAMRICGHTIEPNYHKYATPTGDQIKALAGLIRKHWTALRHTGWLDEQGQSPDLSGEVRNRVRNAIS
jgi:hypothetical protein